MSQHTTATSGRNILVVGAGPAAWRFVRAYHEGAQDAGRASDTITVLNDEPYIPYDRVAIEQLLKTPTKTLPWATRHSGTSPRSIWSATPAASHSTVNHASLKVQTA